MPTKRIRVPVAKPGQLLAKWGRPEPGETPDICYAYGGEGVSRSEGHMLSSYFERVADIDGKTLRQELEARGYDLETLRFSIELKKPPEAET
jgi:hypothetical protein